MARVITAKQVAGVDLARIRAMRDEWYAAPYGTAALAEKRERMMKAHLAAERAAFDAIEKHEDALLERLEKDPGASLVGAIIMKPVADGRAMYVVLKEKPLTLGHVDLMDGYRFDLVWERGLRLKDVQAEVLRRAAMRKIFSNRKEA